MQGCQDPLTEVLDIAPLPVRFAGRLVLTAPWGVSVPAGSALVCSVIGGKCWLTGSGVENPKPVSAGDLILLSPAGNHQLQDHLESPVVSICDLLNPSDGEDPPFSVDSCSGTQTQLSGSFLEFGGAESHPLYSALPPSLHFALGDRTSEIDGILQAIERELSARLPGKQAIVRRLVEVLYAQVTRLYLGTAGPMAVGVIRGMMHQELAAALSRIHSQPDRPWTVESLADHALMSRSSFSAAFSDVLGVPPLQYLREHRMRIASRLLQESPLGLKEIASRIGYQSVSAFSKAFKRFSGLAPVDYRRRVPAAQV
jgi:AraC-like DNA-binding protein